MVIDHVESDGRLSFQVYLPHAEHVDLVGDFTEWEKQPIAMTRGRDREDGWWLAECRVPEGDHAFSYLVDGQYWMPDYAASGLHRNEFGRWTSNLCVGRPRDRQIRTDDALVSI